MAARLRRKKVKATRVCGAKFGILFLRDNDGFRTIATHNVPCAFAESRKREPMDDGLAAGVQAALGLLRCR